VSAGIVVAVAVAALFATASSTPAAATAWRARRRAATLPASSGVRGPAVVHRPPGVGVVERLGQVVRRHDPRVARRADQAVPALLEAVSRELRAGSSLRAAVGSAAADLDRRRPGVDPGATAVVVALERGAPFATAVAAWVDALPTASRQLAGTALTVAADTGGVSGPVVDGVADTLRDRIAVEREVAALSTQARASAAVLVVAPVVVAFGAASADERIAGFLVGSPLGWACIVGGLVLDLVGGAWMYFAVRRAT
jgi:tight adherence protein B